jgi:hypothetical protein
MEGKSRDLHQDTIADFDSENLDKVRETSAEIAQLLHWLLYNPGRNKRFISSPKAPTDPGAHQASY